MAKNDRILKYALDSGNRLVHIETVPNGSNCGCICPCCHKELIAKNNGQIREIHFAHKGDVCNAYYETTLHLLAKEIIKDYKTVMLPSYKILKAWRVRFKEVEVEERKDNSSLQPDCVGITDDGLRIHIEIFVTHKVDESKKEKIEKLGINCLEIHIPDDFPLDHEKLKDFIENTDEGRIWINYPYGEEIIRNQEQEIVKQEIDDQEIVERKVVEQEFVEQLMDDQEIVEQKRARWYMENAKDWLRTASECDRCVLNNSNDNPWVPCRCQYRLEDIEYEGMKYIVCRYMFYYHDNRIGKEGHIPIKDSNGKLSRSVENEEQRIWDMANGICPLCGRQVRRRGALWRCEKPSCIWICNWE